MNYYSTPLWLARQTRQLFYPRRCPFCHRVLGFAPSCPDCAPTLEALRRGPSLRVSGATHYLGTLDGAAAPYDYSGIVRRAVLAAKYQGAPWYGTELGVEMARLLFGSRITMRGAEPTPAPVPGLDRSYDCVVPVPPSSRVRGYNVPECMARPVALALNVPLEPDLLYRARRGTRQEGLSLEERMANVAGAFRTNMADRVEGRRILLVDDVITTGATTAACAQALLDAGAQSVYAVSCAVVERTEPLAATDPVDENDGETGADW